MFVSALSCAGRAEQRRRQGGVHVVGGEFLTNSNSAHVLSAHGVGVL